MYSWFSNAVDTEHDLHATRATHKTFLHSYGLDWCITIFLSVVFLALEEIPGYKRQFSVFDTSIQQKFIVNERVPNWALFIICFVAPLLIQLVINFVSIRSRRDLHSSTLGLVLALALAGSVTRFTKVTVGRPRPDLLDRCQPIPGTLDPIYGLSSVGVCTSTNVPIMRDGFRSFPSGHSSLSFAGLGFLALYIAGKLHFWKGKGYSAKAWISMAPLVGAAFVAISRTMDHRHHTSDVLAGSLLGLTMAYFSYRIYYPSLLSKNSNLPYYPEREEDEEVGTSRYRLVAGSTCTDGEHYGEDEDLRSGGSDIIIVARPTSSQEVWRES